jgi:hypothetical protein
MKFDKHLQEAKKEINFADKSRFQNKYVMRNRQLSKSTLDVVHSKITDEERLQL